MPKLSFGLGVAFLVTSVCALQGNGGLMPGVSAQGVKLSPLQKLEIVLGLARATSWNQTGFGELQAYISASVLIHLFLCYHGDRWAGATAVGW